VSSQVLHLRSVVLNPYYFALYSVVRKGLDREFISAAGVIRHVAAIFFRLWSSSRSHDALPPEKTKLGTLVGKGDYIN
jgi:hypothetical protein